MKEKINSSDVLVAYIDILGYSELVKSGEYANLCYGAIDSALYRWNQYLEAHKYNMGDNVRRHIVLNVMSDTFVVTLDQQAILLEEGGDSSALKCNILIIYLTLISFLIQDCMRQIKLLFRGAIVKGKHYQEVYKNLENSTFIFSEALCGAHYLEQDIANTPRIIVDKAVLDDLQKQELELLFSEKRPDRELLRDNDGFYYLNIYSSVFTNTAFASILMAIADIIRCNLNKQYALHIIGKYIWFANYHNRIVQGVINSDATIPCIQEIKEKQKEILIEIPNI